MTHDPLWVPILTHYRNKDATDLDEERIAAHVSHIAPYVRQILIAGTTGDGWQLDDEQIRQWVRLAANADIFSADHTLLFGAFGDTIEAVVARAQMIERALADHPPVARIAGLTVCAPKDADASQSAILGHFRAVLDHTTLPVSVYQLPQVVGCSIAPETMAAIAEQSSRVTLFKDTSGADAVSQSGVDLEGVILLRGAEGDYVHYIGPNGTYQGWLLSSANAFAL